MPQNHSEWTIVNQSRTHRVYTRGQRNDLTLQEWVPAGNSKPNKQCYYPGCNNTVAISLHSQKQLTACKDHLSTYYTKCTKCVLKDRVKDTKTQRTFLFCSDCYQDYLKTQQNKTDLTCDRCKINVCSDTHRICRSCRREWRTMCVTCRQYQRLDNHYHCQQCYTKYQKNGCKAMIWINGSVGRKQCWAIPSDSNEFCERCSKYGICKTENCTNLSATDKCLECQSVCNEITNYIPDTRPVKNRKICVICKDLEKAPNEIHCGRWSCIAQLDAKT